MAKSIRNALVPTRNSSGSVVVASSATKAGASNAAAKLRSFEGIVTKSTDWRTLNAAPEERAVATEEETR